MLPQTEGVAYRDRSKTRSLRGGRAPSPACGEGGGEGVRSIADAKRAARDASKNFTSFPFLRAPSPR